MYLLIGMEQTLNEERIVRWQKQKRADWLRDKQLIQEGKLRPEDLSWAHQLGWSKGQLDFTGVEAALERDDDFSWTDY